MRERKQSNGSGGLSRPETFVAADVGGTHVRLALVCESNDAGKPVTVLDYRKYRCAEYPGLAEIMAAFFAEVGCAPVRRGVIASAGYALDDGSVITANLPWVLAPNRFAASWACRPCIWSTISKRSPTRPIT